MGISGHVLERPLAQIPRMRSDLSPYRAIVVSGMEAFEKLEHEWSALLSTAQESSLSLNYTWLCTWLRHFPPHELFTVLVYDNAERLVAAAPFMIKRCASGLLCRALRRLQFIGTVPDVYDWMKIIIAPQADAESVLAVIAQKISEGRHRWDMLDLRFCRDLTQLDFLNEALKPHAYSGEIKQSMSIPSIELPETIPDYRSRCRKKKYGSDLKRIRNHLNSDFPKAGLTLEFQKPSPESFQALDDFLNLHSQYWAERGQRTEFRRHPQLSAFYKEIHRRLPQFEFSILKINDQPLSYHFDLQNRDGCMGYLSCYNPAFKKYRPGILHIEAVIEHTLESGKRRFEFGRGDESYKSQWTIQRDPLWSLLIFRSRLAYAFWHGDQLLKAGVNYAASRSKKP